MTARSTRHSWRTLHCLALAGFALLLAGCGTMGTKLQPPAASIQQVTVAADGSWAIVARFQNQSYDTGMHVYAIDATLTVAGKPAGKIAFAPALDIPEMDADIATVTLRPDAAAAAALAAAHGNAVPYELKGTLSVGKGDRGAAQPFPLDGKGYISPVPGVSNIWR